MSRLFCRLFAHSCCQTRGRALLGGCLLRPFNTNKKDNRRTGRSQKPHQLVSPWLLGPQGSAAGQDRDVLLRTGIMKRLHDDVVRLASFSLRSVCKLWSRISTMVTSGSNITLSDFRRKDVRRGWWRASCAKAAFILPEFQTDALKTLLV